MTFWLRVTFVVVILLSLLMRQSAGKVSVDFPFLDHLEKVVQEQDGTIFATRKKSQTHGYISFTHPSCPSGVSIIPLHITFEADALLSVHGFENAPFSVSYFDYAGPYPGKFRLLIELGLTRVTSLLSSGPKPVSPDFAILVVGQDDCEFGQHFDARQFWFPIDEPA